MWLRLTAVQIFKVTVPGVCASSGDGQPGRAGIYTSTDVAASMPASKAATQVKGRWGLEFPLSDLPLPRPNRGIIERSHLAMVSTVCVLACCGGQATPGFLRCLLSPQDLRCSLSKGQVLPYKNLLLNVFICAALVFLLCFSTRSFWGWTLDSEPCSVIRGRAGGFVCPSGVYWPSKCW